VLGAVNASARCADRGPDLRAASGIDGACAQRWFRSYVMAANG
jgi:hypothetical protein